MLGTQPRVVPSRAHLTGLLIDAASRTDRREGLRVVVCRASWFAKPQAAVGGAGRSTACFSTPRAGTRVGILKYALRYDLRSALPSASRGDHVEDDGPHLVPGLLAEPHALGRGVRVGGVVGRVVER